MCLFAAQNNPREGLSGRFQPKVDKVLSNCKLEKMFFDGGILGCGKNQKLDLVGNELQSAGPKRLGTEFGKLSKESSRLS